MKIPIREIVLEKRVRKDAGDLSSLQASMRRLGQLEPVGLRLRRKKGGVEYVLLYGWRRLAAARALGWSEIDARVIADSDHLADLLAERDENVERKQLTLSERGEFARQITPLELAAAKDRQRDGGRRGRLASVKLTEVQKGEALERVAKMVGLSRNTLKKVQAVMAAAEADPEAFGRLKIEMDTTGKVSGPHAKLQALKSSTASKPEDRENELFRVVTTALERLVELKRKNLPVSDRVRTAMKALARIIQDALQDAQPRQ